jgi:hypothetical protein
MVHINKKERMITIQLDGDPEELGMIQASLIDILRNYNYEEGGKHTQPTFFYILNLLEATLPDFDQMHKIFKH